MCPQVELLACLNLTAPGILSSKLPKLYQYQSPNQHAKSHLTESHPTCTQQPGQITTGHPHTTLHLVHALSCHVRPPPWPITPRPNRPRPPAVSDHDALCACPCALILLSLTHASTLNATTRRTCIFEICAWPCAVPALDIATLLIPSALPGASHTSHVSLSLTTQARNQ